MKMIVHSDHQQHMTETIDKFKLNLTNYTSMANALTRCGDRIDVNGWRYSMDMGMNDYEPLDITDNDTQYEYMMCTSFLDDIFGNPGKTETVSSFDLREAAEVWWYTSTSEKHYIKNGVMLLALIAKGYAPSNLWLSMEHHQQGYIPISKWVKFCSEFRYTQRINWIELNDFDETDIVKLEDTY